MSSEKREGVVWGVVLIVLGVLFLAYNLDFLQWRQLREIVGTWWPLILIALGIGQLVRRK